MKNSAIARIAIWSCVLVLLIAAVIFALVGGGVNISFGGLGGYRYSDSSSYLIGDFSVDASMSDALEILDIDWITGSVTISEYDGDEIIVREDGFDEDEDTRLRYRIKNGKLSIRFAKSGWFSFGIGKSSLKKDLTILVPNGKQFRKLDLELVSSSLDVNGISADDFDVDTVSGVVNVQSLTADNIDIEGVSGAVILENISAAAADIEQVSGRTEFSGTVNRIDFNTVSGKITAEFSEAPREVNIESVSGASTIYMPKTGITAKIDSVSGGVRVFGDKLGKSCDITVGDGYMTLNVDTVSGSVEINEK